jgi:predicted nucleic acid-binding protein
MLLCDTGVLLAAGEVKDHHHGGCLALMRAAEGPLLVPSPVLGEIGYLLQSRVGPHAEVTFLKSFGGNRFHIAEVEEGDISRITELVEQYVSLRTRPPSCYCPRPLRDTFHFASEDYSGL